MFNAHLCFLRQRGRKERSMSQRTTEYTETLRFRVPESWPLKVELAARAEEMTIAEWHRQVVRDALKKRGLIIANQREYYPDALKVRAPAQWRSQIAVIAKLEQKSPDEWIRDVIRDNIRSAEEKHNISHQPLVPEEKE